MVRMALWDRCTAAGDPSHDTPRSLFARAKLAPGDEADSSDYQSFNFESPVWWG